MEKHRTLSSSVIYGSLFFSESTLFQTVIKVTLILKWYTDNAWLHNGTSRLKDTKCVLINLELQLKLGLSIFIIYQRK